LRSSRPAAVYLVLAGFLVAGVLLDVPQFAPFWHANGLLVDLADLASADSVALRAHRISVQLVQLSLVEN
jgi:hypothetical protein